MRVGIAPVGGAVDRPAGVENDIAVRGIRFLEVMEDDFRPWLTYGHGLLQFEDIASRAETSQSGDGCGGSLEVAVAKDQLR